MGVAKVDNVISLLSCSVTNIYEQLNINPTATPQSSLQISQTHDETFHEVDSSLDCIHHKAVTLDISYMNDWDILLSLADDLFSLLLSVSSSIVSEIPPTLGYTRSYVENVATDAFQFLMLHVVYDNELFNSLGLNELNNSMHSSNDLCIMNNESLNDIINKARQPLFHKGLRGHNLLKKLQQSKYPMQDQERILDLTTYGKRPFMTSDFIPNQTKECRYGRSYNTMRPIINDQLVDLIHQGKALAFNLETLKQFDQLDNVHCSPMQWATKWQKIKGRVCYHASKKSKTFNSLNGATNLNAHDCFYPEMPLPNLFDICELACQKKKAHPTKLLSGAAIDISSAYQQCVQSMESAKHTCTLAKYFDCISNKWISLLIVYLVVTFGYTRSGHTYATFGRCIDYHHNLGFPLRRSFTYVDDGILIDPDDEINESMSDYKNEIIDLFGQEGVTDDKTKKWTGSLEAIGWEFNFITWQVYPKQKGLQKMMAYLFKLIPPGSRATNLENMEKVTGVLCWYSVAIPAGRSFISSLYVCQSRKLNNGRVLITEWAAHDLNWWRAIVLVAYNSPGLIGDSINHLRTNLVATRFARTDASSTVGGGAVLSLSEGGDPISEAGNAIRWTKAELNLFIQLKISINVLEYFVIVYYTMIWVEHLAGQVISVECDNTSAVSWILKHRTRSEGGEGLDAVAKMFTLFCLIYNIKILCKHIHGVENIIADFNSRDLDLLCQEGDEELFHGMLSNNFSRQMSCRRLLFDCLTKPELVRGPLLLKRLTHLPGGVGSNSVVSKE